MVPHREPANIEISMISCDSTVEPYIIKIFFPPPPSILLPTKENDKRTTPTYTAKAGIYYFS